MKRGKIIITTFFLALICSLNCKAQEVVIKGNKSNDGDIYATPEIPPEFPGGMMGFNAYVSKNYKTPNTFMGSGTIFLSFIVEKDGTLSDITIIRDLGHGTGEEAIRVLKISPKWKPGSINGEPVRVHYNIPLRLNKK